MNSGTDLNARMAICRKAQSTGRHRRAEARETLTKEQKDAGVLGVDAVAIHINDLSFSYKLSTDKSILVLNDLNINFQQGKLYAFVGPPREGKSTLLKLLGQALYPQEGHGDIFIPPHLRVLHVSRDATILRKASFTQNILLNSGSLAAVDGIERVRTICRRVGFSEKMLELVVEDDGTDQRFNSKWAGELSHTDFARLNLARVLVGNPEVLVMHKPALLFDDRERGKIVQLLREHVDEKGIEMPIEGRKGRRPRTMFFTSMSAVGVKIADAVYKVSLKDGVEHVAKDGIHDDLLS
jgi:ABC-type transport system involved in cytochrome bd biosynthesis fused ATPase/permease subunit